MTDAEHIRQTLGQLLEGQRRLQEDMTIIRAEHQKTREMVVQNRAGARVIGFIGMASIAVVAAVSGFWRS